MWGEFTPLRALGVRRGRDLLVERDLSEAPGRRLDGLEDVVLTGHEDSDLAFLPGPVTPGL